MTLCRLMALLTSNGEISSDCTLEVEIDRNKRCLPRKERNGRARHTGQRLADKVEALVVKLGFAQSLAADGQLQDRTDEHYTG